MPTSSIRSVFKPAVRIAAIATITALSQNAAFAGSNDKLVKAINQGIQQAFPKVVVVDVKKSPVEGLYQVEAEDGAIFYTDKKGRILAKELFQIEGDKVVSVAEAAYAKNRSKYMKDIKHDGLISFKPEGKSRGEIFVFTDVNCPYCRKFHQDLVPAANKLGITVSYIAFPVIGGEKSMKEMKSAWCAADPKQRAELLAKLKNGETIDEDLCEDNPISAHMDLGRDMRITGTPTALFSDGNKVDLNKFEEDLKTHFKLSDS